MNTVARLPRGDAQAFVLSEIRAWMGRRDVNQTEMAEALGISQSQMSKRLRGRIPIDIVELGVMADYLGITIAELVGGEPGRSPHPDGGMRMTGRSRRASMDTSGYPYQIPA